MTAELLEFPSPGANLTPDQARSQVDLVLAVPISERGAKARSLHLEDPELLLSVCEWLRERLEASPSTVRDEAEFFYRFLESPRREIGYFDEREYYLGEFALLAGCASRFLFRRDDARRWLDRAAANFVRAANASAHIARVAYQRLAVSLEERHHEEVLELAPLWSENASRFGLPEEALKTRFLEGLALRELGRLPEAIRVFTDLLEQAGSLSNDRLVASAANNLAQLYRLQGDPESALDQARRALTLLTKTKSRVGLVKLRWCVGDILREQERMDEAIDAYREAAREAEEVGMRGDAAAIHLVLADALLQVGQEAQAEWEIRAALPIIDEERMVPERVAALSLLRESLRRRKIDRQALRNLHGYFRE